MSTAAPLSRTAPRPAPTRAAARGVLQLLLALTLLLASGLATRHLLGHAVERITVAAAVTALDRAPFPSTIPSPRTDTDRGLAGLPAHCDACDGLQSLFHAHAATSA